MIEYDCETTGLQPWSGRQYAFLHIFLSADGKRCEAIHVDDDNWRERVQAWFDEADADPEGIQAWNSKFDRAFAEQAGFNVPGDGKWHDGMIVAHAIDERRSVALKAVASQLFGEDVTDPQKAVKTYLTQLRASRKKQAEADGTELIEPNYSDVPMEIMEPYALDDVILTRKVSEQYAPVLAQKPDLQRVVDFERPVMDALYAIEKRGLPARIDDYRLLEQEVIDNLERLDDRITELASEGDPVIFAKSLGKDCERGEDGSLTYTNGGELSQFNPNSSQQVIAALKARKADMRFMSQKDGKLSADAENLRACDDELAAAILQFRSEAKVLSTYVRPMIGRSYETSMRMWKEPYVAADGRIHATYRQVGARTGRMSCSDPNMQNQPRDDLRLRYCIAADPGYKLVAVDLKNIEMVLFAAFAGEGRMLTAVQNGEDLHELTAEMLGIRDRARPGGEIETARQLGKTYNFSRVYGGGLRTIRRQFRCSQDEAKQYKARFDRAYPEVQRLINRIEYRLQDTGYIQDHLISGRRFRVDPRDAFKAPNYLIQGTAAALLKYAVVKLHEDGIPMVALIHDEIVAHVPEGDAVRVQAQMEARMTEHPALREVVPLAAEGAIIDRWSDAKPMKDGSLFVPRFAEAA